MLPPKIIKYLNEISEHINAGNEIITQNEGTSVIVYFNDTSITMRPTRSHQTQQDYSAIDHIRLDILDKKLKSYSFGASVGDVGYEELNNLLDTVLAKDLEL